MLVAKDADHDGVRAANCAANSPGVNVEVGLDCDDTKSTVKPGAPELCNGIDDNCNSVIDDGIPPQGTCESAGTGQCKRKGQFECANGTFSKCNAVPGTPAPDFPACDGKDTACDGSQQVGCECTVGSQTGGAFVAGGAAKPNPAWGFVWCQRNCSVTKVYCQAGRINCAAPGPEELGDYCKDSDGDQYYDAATCSKQCINYSPATGGPSPLKPQREAKFITQADHRADCNDQKLSVHPGANELCTPAGVDENCDGDAYRPLPRPGASGTCARTCGNVRYSGSKTANSACVWDKCTPAAAEQFGIVDINGKDVPLSRIPVDRPWTHGHGSRCNGDRHWCAEGSGSDEVVTGPNVALPEGRYILHVRGSHSTASTWIWVEDNGGEVAGTSRNFKAPTAVKLRIDSDIAFSVPGGSDCHSYQIKLRSTPHGWFIYGTTVEEVWFTRE